MRSILGASDVAITIAAFAVALLAALGSTPLARRAAIRLRIFDQPGQRKAHADPVPYLGGLAIILAFTVAMGAGAAARGLEGSAGQAATILGGGLVLAAMGLWDDLRGVPGWVKAAVEIPLAAALYASGIRAEVFDAEPLNLLLTVGWVCGIVNAVNFLDNMDGLTAGVSAVAASYFAALAALSGQILVASLSAAVAGCSLGFLWYNRRPARIFMGDTGTLFLGWLLAVLALELRFNNLERVTFFVPVAVLAVPIFDTLLISISRVCRGLSPLHPGLDHTSHRLVHLGLPHSAAVGLHYVAAVAAGWLGVVIAFARPLTAYLLMGWLVGVGAFLGVLLLQIRPDD
jgi:UDP-GlcNAc:undecaprenyl-phosphate GlcNAc-1-phosphate transferase